MNLKICDVCYHGKERKISEAKWKIVFKKGMEKLPIDLCEGHKEWPKGKTYNDALNAIFDNATLSM